MRILPFTRRILSQDERKVARNGFSRRLKLWLVVPGLAAGVLLGACSGPPSPAPTPPAESPALPPAPSAPPVAGPASPAPGPASPEPAPASPAPGPAAPAPPAPRAAAYRAGTWLESRWLDEATPWAEVSQALQDLADRGITDLYIRTGSLRADGTLALPSADRVAAARREASALGLRLWAWLPGLRHRLDLSQPDTVRAAAASVADLAAAGFDGVQLDLEPTPDDDAGYLALLDAIQAALPAGRLLGAATHLVRPHPARAEWSPEYFSEVAKRVDQIAVMAYDTYAATPEEFRLNVAYQTEIALARSPASTEVLIGVPTYEDRTERHTPETEPPWAGLAGVADGFTQADLAGRVTGWALYAHFTTSEAEWRLFADRPAP